MLASVGTKSMQLAAGLHPPARSALMRCRTRYMSVTSRATYDTPQGADDGLAQPAKYLAKFNVYKGKAAMQMSLIGPTWKPTPKGSFYVDREGVLFVEFANVAANAGQQSGYGDRSYNWSEKLVFAMKPVELGNLLDDKLTAKGFEMFHDPDKGSQNEGMMRKTLAVKLNPDGSSFMFSINQSEKTGQKAYVSVPVSLAEMAVIKNLVGFAMPRLMGFDMACESMHTM